MLATLFKKTQLIELFITIEYLGIKYFANPQISISIFKLLASTIIS